MNASANALRSTGSMYSGGFASFNVWMAVEPGSVVVVFSRPTKRAAASTMRVLLQRVSRAEVRVGERITGRIERGLLLLVGFIATDTTETLTWMADKVVGLRIFADQDDKMNLSVAD